MTRKSLSLAEKDTTLTVKQHNINMQREIIFYKEY